MSGGGHSLELVGQYEYDKTNILGHGAFAVVYKGCNRMVSVFIIIFIIKRFIKKAFNYNIYLINIKYWIN